MTLLPVSCKEVAVGSMRWPVIECVLIIMHHTECALIADRTCHFHAALGYASLTSPGCQREVIVYAQSQRALCTPPTPVSQKLTPGQPTPGAVWGFTAQELEDEYALNNFFWGMTRGVYLVGGPEPGHSSTCGLAFCKRRRLDAC